MEQETKKSSWKSWVFGILAGVCLIVLGGAGIIKNESVNNALIQMGANQTAAGAIELNNDLAPVFVKIADTIDAAVEARHADPEKLSELINTSVQEYTDIDVKPAVSAAVDYINQAYKASESEDVYAKKLTCLAAGFRAAAISKSQAEIK